MYIFLIILTSEVKMIKLYLSIFFIGYFSTLSKITANQSPLLFSDTSFSF